MRHVAPYASIALFAAAAFAGGCGHGHDDMGEVAAMLQELDGYRVSARASSDLGAARALTAEHHAASSARMARMDMGMPMMGCPHHDAMASELEEHHRAMDGMGTMAAMMAEVDRHHGAMRGHLEGLRQHHGSMMGGMGMGMGM